MKSEDVKNTIKFFKYIAEETSSEMIRKHCEVAIKALKEQGTLVKLPCEVGDKIWLINNKSIIESEVVSFLVDDLGIAFIHVKYLCDKEHSRYYGYDIGIDEIGDTAFFILEEAEQKLEELRKRG